MSGASFENIGWFTSLLSKVPKVLSTFLWLGFYLTIVFKIIFKLYVINEGEGNFRFLPHQFDTVLIWTSVAVTAFIASSIFHRFIIDLVYTL